MTGTQKRQTREESRAKTRADLLDAARELFARQGFEGSSVEQISEAAGYSRGAFYSNFTTKEDLLIALIERCFQQDLDDLHRVGRDDPAATSVSFQQSATRDLSSNVTHLIKMEFWMTALRYPRVREAYEANHARLRAAIGALITTQFTSLGAPLPAPADQLAAVIVALRNGLDTQKLINPDAFPDDLYATTLRLLLTGAAHPQPDPRTEH